MYYILYIPPDKKTISKNIDVIAKIIDKKSPNMRKLLKSGQYIKNGVIILKFNEKDIIKAPSRNKSGNPDYKKLSAF
jgi:type VI protein secretion system component Hcp